MIEYKRDWRFPFVIALFMLAIIVGVWLGNAPNSHPSPQQTLTENR